jgi:[protein-PII] uridylyltransferase
VTGPTSHRTHPATPLVLRLRREKDLDSMHNEIGRLRKAFRLGRANLFNSAALSLPCRELQQKNTALIDSLVRDIYDFSCSRADSQADRTVHSGLAIIATGGYGRGELDPFSDIDIAFIPSEEEDPWVEAAVHVAFKLVMDVFLSFRDIRVGYSYRPVAELSTWDLVTLTSLLDSRHICGDRAISAALSRELRQQLSPLDLILEYQTAGQRQQSDPVFSLYSVEPRIKEGPGSLRDLHRARWIYRLLLPPDCGDLPEALAAMGYITPERARKIEAASLWFWRTRIWLHLTTNKKSDVLINNYQDRAARDLGGTSAQAWLSRHFEHAETLARFRDSAIRRVLQGPRDLGGIILEAGRLQMAEARPHSNPTRLFYLSQKYDIAIRNSDFEELEERNSAGGPPYEFSPEDAWAFLSILNASSGVASALRMLVRSGAMESIIDGFTGLMRFVPPDPAHNYTVGEHSLKIIEHLEELRDGRNRTAPLFCDMVRQCSHFDMLCLAALLHDSGKMLPGRDHSESGMGLTARVAERLLLPPEKREILEILVRHHLLLVRTARLQDLKSPAVIQSVADQVNGSEALRHLYVFTYADTRAVAEKNWTSMDYRDLEELYGKVHGLLGGQTGDGTGNDAIENRIGQIRRRLSSALPEDENAVLKHCDSMPAAYVLNTPLDEIANHLHLIRRLPSENVVLDVYNRPGDDFSELTVCTHDDPRPGMLAKITGVLYGCNIDIHKAQVFTLEQENPVVLDTLWVRSSSIPLSETRAGRMRKNLREVLTGLTTLDEFLRGAGKNPPESIPLDSLELRNDLSEEHTVVHVVARDLQGLLYVMTRALSRTGLHIHSAKVATWNARAENNFYITSLTGGQIPKEDLPLLREQLIRTLRGIG